MNNPFTIPCNFKIQYMNTGRFNVTYADGSKVEVMVEQFEKIQWVQPELFSLDQVSLISEQLIPNDDVNCIKYATYRLIADTPLIDDDASNPEPNSLYCLKSSISTMQNIFQISNNEYIPCWLLTGNNVHILDYCELTES